MNATDVEMALNAVELREKVILHLAIFSGLRPGEILALQRCNVAADGSSVGIEQRVYRGDLDAPKNGKTRVVAVPPRAAAMLAEWLEAAVDSEPTAWVFASENRETPLWRDNLLRRHIRPALEKGRPGLGRFQSDAADEREFGPRRQGGSEGVRRPTRPRHRCLA